MEDCLFCKIIAGDIPSSKVYEDDLCYAFNDIDPQAPTHFLVIPKQHIQSVAAVDASNSAVVAHCFEVIAKIAKERGMDSFRVVSNIGEQGGSERVPSAFPRPFRTGYDLAAGLISPSPCNYVNPQKYSIDRLKYHLFTESNTRFLVINDRYF